MNKCIASDVQEMLPDLLHERLDRRRFDFHVYARSISDCGKDCIEGWDLHGVREWKLPQLRRREFGDSANRRTLRIHDRIMMNDHRAITRGVNVELDRVGTELYCAKEGGD